MSELLRRADEIPVTMVTAIAYLTLAFVTDVVDPTLAQLMDYGACRGVEVADGEAWRLLTYAFLHGGWWHLAMNTYALVTIGPMLELSLGSARFLLLYVVGALGGSIAGCLWHGPFGPFVGGSGALFAMMGGIVALQSKSNRDPLAFVRTPSGSNVLGNIVANFVIGLILPFISNAGHFGGLVAGFALTFWFLVPTRADERRKGALRLALLVAGCGALLAVLWPVTRIDRLVRAWEDTPPSTRRDALRQTLPLVTVDDRLKVPSALDDSVMAELAGQLREARRWR